MSQEREVAERARAARAASVEVRDMLSSVGDGAADLKVALAIDGGSRTILLPREAAQMLLEVLEALGDGQEPSVVPMSSELTTGEVASLLGVSRQYVVRLLDADRLPFRRVGNRRRVPLRDVMRYLREDNRRRVDGLREVADATLS